MGSLHSEEFVLDEEAVSLALKAPPVARLDHPESGKFRKYRLEDRLNAGVIGSMPPPPHVIRAMSPTFPKQVAVRPAYIAGLLVAVTMFVGAVIYRDMTRGAPDDAPAAEVNATTAP